MQHTPQLLANTENKLIAIIVVAFIIPTPHKTMYGLGITLDTLQESAPNPIPIANGVQPCTLIVSLLTRISDIHTL